MEEKLTVNPKVAKVMCCGIKRVSRSAQGRFVRAALSSRRSGRRRRRRIGGKEKGASSID